MINSSHFFSLRIIKSECFGPNARGKEEYKMSYSFEIFIADVSPAQAISLFDEDVEEGRDNYEIAKQDGAYVFFSIYTDQLTSEIIHEHTGMSLEICASCSVSGSADLDVAALTTILIDNALHQTDSDFLVISEFEMIITMRRGGNVTVSALAEKWYGVDMGIFDMPYEIRELDRW